MAVWGRFDVSRRAVFVQPKAMKLPMRVQWPDSQVLFLLLGGNDIFRSGDIETVMQRMGSLRDISYHLYQYRFISTRWPTFFCECVDTSPTLLGGVRLYLP